MKSWTSVAVAFLAIFLSLRSYAQGTFRWTVTFDGAPEIQPSDEFLIRLYQERDLVFTPADEGQFGRSGGQPSLTAFPRSGSAYLFAMLGNSLAFRSLSGSRFGLVSVDLAEFSTLYQTPLPVRFVGYRPDGTIVTTEFFTDGIIDGAGPLNDFQTFHFGSGFSDLVRVEVPTYGWSLDNMVFSNVIPEPGAIPLLALGAGIFCAIRMRTKKPTAR